jgi:recombination protein RecR
LIQQSPLITELIEAFTQLPGIGPKSAQRMAFSLLEKNRSGGLRLAHAIEEAITKVGHCQQCRNFSEEETCALCASAKRERDQLCIVETPADVMAIEQSGVYQGLYFVLMGHLSPIDGIGPEALGLDKLEQRLKGQELEELILATNPTVEGEATAHYIQQIAQRYQVKMTRLAQGIPLGSELEYIDSGTLTQAFSTRSPI